MTGSHAFEVLVSVTWKVYVHGSLGLAETSFAWNKPHAQAMFVTGDVRLLPCVTVNGSARFDKGEFPERDIV